MKKTKRWMICLMACAMACLSVFSIGCMGDDEDESIDNEKTQIYVSNYNGGYGDEWLQKIKKSFESEYASFQLNGKTGVQVIINNHKSSSSELASVAASKNEIYFLSGSYYNEASKGNFLDITDIVEEGGENSLANKLSAEQRDFYKSVNNKYYGLPRYEGVFGFIYNVDKFNDEHLYFAKNGCPSEDGYTGIYSYTNLSGERSTGPNGEYGDYDDGLPATYEEMFVLFQRMYEKGITPITWTGWYYLTYLSWLLEAMACDYEGEANLNTYYNLSGQITSYVESITNNSGNLFDDLNITAADISKNTGYKAFGVAGKYYALKVLEKIISDEKYYDSVNAFKSTVSHTDAQYNFLDDDKNVAMLAEGSWWENEAKASFGLLDKDMKTCRFSIMPIPKVSKEKLGPATYVEQQGSFAFINGHANPAKVPLLKAFFKYCYSDKALEDFTSLTNAPIAMNYSISDQAYNNLTYFGKSIWDIHKGTNGAKVVYPISSNKDVLNAFSSFKYSTTFKSKIGDNKPENYPFDLFRQGTKAVDYFNGIKTYYSNNWSSIVG